MSKKRDKKMNLLKDEIAEPEYFGSPKAKTVLVGSGNTKNPILDIITNNLSSEDIAYLHYEYIYPTKTEKLTKLAQEGKRIILVENNQTGQFGSLITQETGYIFKERLLKYDGRPFFVEDILDFLNN